MFRSLNGSRWGLLRSQAKFTWNEFCCTKVKLAHDDRRRLQEKEGEVGKGREEVCCACTLLIEVVVLQVYVVCLYVCACSATPALCSREASKFTVSHYPGSRISTHASTLYHSMLNIITPKEAMFTLFASYIACVQRQSNSCGHIQIVRD